MTFFAAMAGAFLRDHPPTSRMLMLYGDALPGWLQAFPPVAHLGYLPDVARLDQAMRESYHAADSEPLPEAEFQRLVGSDMAALRLALAPSLRLVRSSWPVQSIWAATAEAGPTPQPGAEAALVLRPQFDPRPHRLSGPDGTFVQSLMDGKTLGQSLDAAGVTDRPSRHPVAADRWPCHYWSNRMTNLLALYQRAAMGADRQADWILPTAARLVFAGVLFSYFWTSAGTKLDGLFTPSLGAYAQIFPKAFEAAGYDVSQMGLWQTLVVLAGAWAEVVAAGSDRPWPFHPAGSTGNGRLCAGAKPDRHHRSWRGARDDRGLVRPGI